MHQHHYLFDSIDDLQKAYFDLEDLGIPGNRLHVIHKNHVLLEKRHLNDMGFLSENDMVHTGLRGFALGVLLSGLCGFALYEWLTGHELAAVVTVFVSLIVLGFCTWVGGLIGASHDNWRVSPYHDLIAQGKCLLIVDVLPAEEELMIRMMAAQHRESTHSGESSSIDLPWAGGWKLRIKDVEEAA